MRAFCIISILALFFTLPVLAADKESVYERVMRTETIRCGYFVGPPYIIQDANSGQLSGIWYDYMEALGRELGFEIEWAEEVGLGDFGVALDSGRIDVMCLGIWVDPQRAKAADFVTPISYNGPQAYVREDDVRFDHDYRAINSESVTISYIDGDVGSVIARTDFPKAKTMTLPQLSQISEAMDNVTSGKADIVFYTPAAVEIYNKNHEEKLRRVPLNRSVRAYEESVAVRRGEHDFRQLLNHTTRFLINNGVIDRIIRKYDPERKAFLPVARPYEISE